MQQIVKSHWLEEICSERNLGSAAVQIASRLLEYRAGFIFARANIVYIRIVLSTDPWAMDMKMVDFSSVWMFCDNFEPHMSLFK
jgi:hypothetical protein